MENQLKQYFNNYTGEDAVSPIQVITYYGHFIF